MNYLAHIYIADNNDESMLGKFLGDFVNKSLENNYEYSSVSLEEYVDNFYSILKRYSYCLPDKLTKRMPFMIEENWLLSYKEIDGIKKPLDRISRAFSKTNHPLLNPIDELISNYKSLESDFERFFSIAIEYANKLKEN